MVISGKDVNLEFKMSDSNKNILIDNQGNEYEKNKLINYLIPCFT